MLVLSIVKKPVHHACLSVMQVRTSQPNPQIP